MDDNALSDSGRTTSVWMTSTTNTTRKPLDRNVNVEVCVIGAGIAGLTTAYKLARQGRSVVVLDDGPVGGGETGRTSAHLTNALDDRYHQLERWHGEDGARLAAESHTAAIDEIERIVDSEAIDCGFARVDGYLVAPPGEAPDELKDELVAARRAGLDQVDLIDRLPFDGFDYGPALRFPRQAEFHALEYLFGLARAVERLSGRVYTGSHVNSVDSDGLSARIETADHKVVTADNVVVATNVPFNDRVALHTKQAPYRTYVVAAQVPADSLPHMLLWDTCDPYHYVRLHTAEDGEYLIVGGEDHKTGQATDYESRFARLEMWARERFPMAKDFDRQWSGQVMEPIDGLAFIGRNPSDNDNVFVATGDSGNGLTHGTIAGILISDLIAGRNNPWAKLYEPSRKTLSAAGEFLKENLNVAVQYADHIKRGDVRSVDDLPAGSGALLQQGVHKIAVFRSDDGKLCQFSATCPHLGCIVQWNGLERSWDCPCHGSRFAADDGHVLFGPAISGLTPAKD